MNTDARIARQAITFALGGLITLLFLYCVGLLTPGNAMKDYYDLKCFGSFIVIELLCFVIEQLIVNLTKDEKEKEQIHLQKWRDELSNLLVLEAGPYWCLLLLESNVVERICKLIDKLCKDKYVKIEDKKVFYDKFCEIWTKYGLNKCIYTVPPEIQKKWKKAQAEDKLRQLKKDF